VTNRDEIADQIRALEVRIETLRILLGVASNAVAAGFEATVGRFERIEGRIAALEARGLGERVNGFDGAGEAETPPAIIEAGTSA
jgi:hypothetical protein